MYSTYVQRVYSIRTDSIPGTQHSDVIMYVVRDAMMMKLHNVLSRRQGGGCQKYTVQSSSCSSCAQYAFATTSVYTQQWCTGTRLSPAHLLREGVKGLSEGLGGYLCSWRISSP